uniref:NADH-ubiquinone oxidoreductase chain 6 n=1 Tax=Sivaloka damnosus TaxID=568780 RepID=D8KZH2_SIVDA|nr:NADH dehydrogenase subunit 6 [Sivaloka damnosus]
MIKILMLNSMITPMMNHPISMGTMLMTQTILISVNLSMNKMNSWFSYILFLTIIGGMMVMFMYMASIASNEKFKQTPKIMIIIVIWLIMMIIMKDKPMEILEKTYSNKNLLTEMEFIKTTSKFFNLYKMDLTIIMMMILLLTMISVTNISNTFEGPFKKKPYV